MTGIGRISTAQTFQSSLNSINDAQRFLARTQEQLATGKKISTPSDDPVASAQIISLRNSLARIADYQSNTDRASGTLAFEESVIGGIENALHQIRDLVLRSQNPVLNEQNRQALATETDGVLDQLLALGNTQNADGEYIFGGHSSKIQPYELSGGAITANSFGDVGVRNISVADGIQIQVSNPGTEVFYTAPGNGAFTVEADSTNTGRSYINTTSAVAGFDQTQDYSLALSETLPGSFVWTITGSVSGTYTGNFSEGENISFGLPGEEGTVKIVGMPADGDTFQLTSNNTSTKSLFEVVLNVRDALVNSSAPADRAIADTILGDALQSIDRNLTQLSLVRADIGTRLNRVDDQANLNSAFNLELNKSVSSLEDIDYAEAISSLQLQLVALQAAQQAFVKTTGLTIFNYL